VFPFSLTNERPVNGLTGYAPASFRVVALSTVTGEPVMHATTKTTKSPAILALATLCAAIASTPAFAADQPARTSSICPGSEMSRAQQIVVANENEKARLGAQGFSPLPNFPVPEVGWGCWR
jgi:hypothetical protein